MTSKTDDWHQLVWKIENFSYCWHKFSECVSSPKFCMENAYWRLLIFPRGKCFSDRIACVLKREGSFTHKLKFELKCLDIDGSSLSEWSSCNETYFATNETYGTDSFAERNEVFVDKRMEYLPNDTLTVCCRISRSKKLSSFCKFLFTRTRIKVCCLTITDQIKEFSSFESKNIKVPTASPENPILKVNVSLDEGACCDDNISIEIFSENNKQRKFSTCKVFLLDATGSKLKCGQSEIWFDENETDQNWKFQLIFTKWELMEKKDLYLPDDILSLKFECTSSMGISDEVTESINCVASAGVSDSDSDSTKEASTLEVLESMHRENILCDVNLQTRTKTFPAHKAILSARSPVFKVTFTNDTKEKPINQVDIEDLDDETVCRLLLYIYTNTVEDLEWQTAFQLYIAADKYSILSLRKRCGSLLVRNIDLKNVCELLDLADKYKDKYLKNYIHNYIIRHDRDIIMSDEWKDLEIKNPQLTSETMCYVYRKAKGF